MSDPAISETERWFLKRGLPHFVDDYSPTRDVLTRTVPLLTLMRRSLAVRAVYLAALGRGLNPRRSSTISST